MKCHEPLFLRERPCVNVMDLRDCGYGRDQVVPHRVDVEACRRTLKQNMRGRLYDLYSTPQDQECDQD